jgi:hypothetical protein
MATTTHKTQQMTRVDASPRRRAIASYTDYQDAERAVDWLSDQGFAVERGAIVGKGLRSVEQVTGRVTVWRAALIGAGEGMLIGALFALLFGIVFTGPELGGLLLYSLVVGGLFGSGLGALVQALLGGRRDFGSTLGIEAERYEVQIDEVVAAEAKHVLEAMPTRDGTR